MAVFARRLPRLSCPRRRMPLAPEVCGKASISSDARKGRDRRRRDMFHSSEGNEAEGTQLLPRPGPFLRMMAMMMSTNVKRRAR